MPCIVHTVASCCLAHLVCWRQQSRRVSSNIISNPIHILFGMQVSFLSAHQGDLLQEVRGLASDISVTLRRDMKDPETTHVPRIGTEMFKLFSPASVSTSKDVRLGYAQPPSSFKVYLRRLHFDLVEVRPQLTSNLGAPWSRSQQCPKPKIREAKRRPVAASHAMPLSTSGGSGPALPACQEAPWLGLHLWLRVSNATTSFV